MKKILIPLLMMIIGINQVIASAPIIGTNNEQIEKNIFYEKNMDDEVKLYNVTRKILLRLETSENTEVLQTQVKDKIAELLWKNSNEIGNSSSIYKQEYQTFKEYWLTYIYHHIMYDINSYYISWEWRILENSFARVFVNTPDIYMTEKAVFYKHEENEDYNMIDFFKTEESIEDYLNNTILEEEFQWKCRAIKSEKKGTLFSDNQSYTIAAFWDYKWEFRNPSDCWKYWSWFWIRYFEKRGDYIIYINAWQEFNWLFYRFIDMK